MEMVKFSSWEYTIYNEVSAMKQDMKSLQEQLADYRTRREEAQERERQRLQKQSDTMVAAIPYMAIDIGGILKDLRFIRDRMDLLMNYMQNWEAR